MTANLASGGAMDKAESDWVTMSLQKLRAPGARSVDHGRFNELKRIFMRARLIQGAIVGSRQALPLAIEASEQVRSGAFYRQFDEFSSLGLEQTEKYLCGSDNGVPRKSNDYPDSLKTLIAALAGLLAESNNKAYEELTQRDPELVRLAQDADELQRLSWALLRCMINEVVSQDEIAKFRTPPLSESTDVLLATICARLGSVPARVMQRDNWEEALQSPRQDAHFALFNTMKNFVEVAEIAVLYSLGSIVVRTHLGGTAEEVVRQHVRHGVQEIAAGTRKVTHKARFQSRVGARPCDFRSFREFLASAKRKANGSCIGEAGQIVWIDEVSERGWCPAQNLFLPLEGGAERPCLAMEGNAMMAAWKQYGRERFGVEPNFRDANSAELVSAITVFVSVANESPIHPRSELVRDSSLAICGSLEPSQESSMQSAH